MEIRGKKSRMNFSRNTLLACTFLFLLQLGCSSLGDPSSFFDNHRLFPNPTSPTSLGDVHRRLLGGASLFGSVNQIDSMKGSISVLIVIAAVFMIENFFEYMDELTEDTPYENVVRQIQRELMTVGCMAFVLKLGEKLICL